MQSPWIYISWTFHFQSTNLNDWMCLTQSSSAAMTEGLHKRLLFGPTWRAEQEGEQFLCAIMLWNQMGGEMPSPFCSKAVTVWASVRAECCRGAWSGGGGKIPLCNRKRRKPFARCKLPGAFAIAAWSHWRMRMEVADDLSMGLALRRIRILELLYCLRDQPDVSTCPSYHVGVSSWFHASIKQSSISISMDGCIWGLIP